MDYLIDENGIIRLDADFSTFEKKVYRLLKDTEYYKYLLSVKKDNVEQLIKNLFDNLTAIFNYEKYVHFHLYFFGVEYRISLIDEKHTVERIFELRFNEDDKNNDLIGYRYFSFDEIDELIYFLIFTKIANYAEYQRSLTNEISPRDYKYRRRKISLISFDELVEKFEEFYNKKYF